MEAYIEGGHGTSKMGRNSLSGALSSPTTQSSSYQNVSTSLTNPAGRPLKTDS